MEPYIFGGVLVITGQAITIGYLLARRANQADDARQSKEMVSSMLHVLRESRPQVTQETPPPRALMENRPRTRSLPGRMPRR